ncbi:MAG: hypothetical protein M1812_005550 [Candelaria pacifica]|nr:MAG: hypothetical protein M1812_005550 [Candelaria pacifica]
MGETCGTRKSKKRPKPKPKHQTSNNPDEADRDRSNNRQPKDVDKAESNHNHIHTQPHKLQRLPQNARIQKRPMLRPPIASPYAGKQAQKVVYISSKTPFISAVKRTRKLLNQIDKRSMGKVSLLGNGKDREKVARTGKVGEGEQEEVVLKATGKAIEKAMGLALFFQGQEDCKVRIRTGSVMVVDDIMEIRRPKPEATKAAALGVMAGQKRKRSGDKTNGNGMEASDMGKQVGEKPRVDLEGSGTDKEAEETDDEMPETQMRQTSMIEIAVTQSIQ